MANEKFIKFAKEKDWKKLAKIGTKKNLQDVLDVAEACGYGRSEEARNILIDILARPEREAKIAAIKGLGALRYDPDSQTEALRHANPGNDPELADLIKASIDALRDFTRESKK